MTIMEIDETPRPPRTRRMLDTATLDEMDLSAQFALADAIRDVFAEMASAFTEASFETQIRFLRCHGMSDDELERLAGPVFIPNNTEVLYEVTEHGHGSQTHRVWVPDTVPEHQRIDWADLHAATDGEHDDAELEDVLSSEVELG